LELPADSSDWLTLLSGTGTVLYTSVDAPAKLNIVSFPKVSWPLQQAKVLKNSTHVG